MRAAALARRPLTLRGRLLAALLVCSAFGLAAFIGASELLLRHSLMDRVDGQLHDFSHRFAAGPPPSGPPPEAPVRVRLPSDFRMAVLEPDGTPRYEIGQQSGQAGSPKLPKLSREAVWQHNGRPFTVPDQSGSGEWRVRAVELPDGEIGVAALSLAGTDATLERLLIIEAAVGGVVLVLLTVAATVVVRVGLRPLTRIERTAEAIAAGDLDRRVPENDPRTETGRLGAALNVMLGRLSAALHARERSEQRLRRFVADASHELRTPLTSIRGFAELYRRGGAADVERLMGRIESEAKRMGILVDDLLLLARLDQERALDITDVDLLVLAGDAVHDAKAREPDRPVTLVPGSGAVRVLGDEHRLRQVVGNLVTNALTHTPAGTPVRLTVAHRPAQERNGWPVAAAGADRLPDGALGLLEVHDDGPGIPAEAAAHVFDRFYRADRSRARTRGGGAGLGLAISAAILEAHNGRIELYSAPDRGTTFRVLLPLA
ncbi:sensor histidine kinase [Gandjariella thermophila]|uniref:histidine kinase n=1 Tax=Gandjariella thermophila TaxID=1931992 RepID=A0A4D4J5C7_9PSEU|nr:HAMP domain-containing sensor histidine kinase [Gandjariella thermophila]GDY30290.1 two-component sensor histidine kinase [Gandjariella thermophila]